MSDNKMTNDANEMSSRVEDAVIAYGPSSASLNVDHIPVLGARYDMSLADFAEILEVTPKTLHRWKSQHHFLSPQQSSRVEIVESIFELGLRVLGSQKAVNAWVREPVLLLGGRKPLDLLKTESGRRAVEGALRQIELGMF